MHPVLLLLPSAIAFETFEGFSFYAGDPHAHTGVSTDARASDVGVGCRDYPDCGSLAGVFDTARANGLDWVAFTDHVNGGSTHAATEEAYEDFFAEVLAHDDAGTGLLVVPAAEVSLSIEGDEIGHRNLYLFADDADLADFSMADALPTSADGGMLPSCAYVDDWMESLEDRFGPALLLPHHPLGASPRTTDWSCYQPTWGVAVEVYSVWGLSLGWDRLFDPASSPVDGASVHDAMDTWGYNLGFLAGTDDHLSLPGDVCRPLTDLEIDAGGLTIAVVPEGEVFDRGALYNAIVAHHTYATSGPKVPLTVEWTMADVVTAGLGDDLTFPAGQDPSVHVRVPEAYASWVLGAWLVTTEGSTPIPETEEGWAQTLAWDAAPSWAYVAVQLSGDLAWGGAGCMDGWIGSSEWLWASPTWLTMVDHDDDHDHFTFLGGDCDDTNPDIRPGVRDVWYDGIDANCDGLDDWDADRDGHRALDYGGDDCEDHSPFTHPGMRERWYDGIDANCDGRDDYDVDNDGHRASTWGGDDCDDANAKIHPGMKDRKDDGIDSDCDGGDD